MPGFGASDALVGRRSRRGWLAAAAVALPLGAAAICEAAHLEEYEFFIAILGLIEAVGFLLLPAIAPEDGIMTGLKRGAVRADRAGVHFKKKLALARSEIESAWVEGMPGGARRVHLCAKRARDDRFIEVEDDTRVRTLLEALELRHDRHAASFIVESAPLRTDFMQKLANALAWLGGSLLALTVFILTMKNVAYGFTLVPALLIYSLIVKRAKLMSRVIVGADGLVVRAGGVLRQIPLATIAKASLGKGPEAEVKLESGETLTFRFSGEGAAEKAKSFSARVQESLIRVDRSSKEDRIAALLTRAGRSADEWLTELRRITSGSKNNDRGYRANVIPDEDLWRIIEHPSADSEARAGALAALHSRLDEPARIRIAEIGEATARQDLRAAFEAAASGESEEEILAPFAKQKPD